MSEFVTPDFLKNCSTDDFYNLIKNEILPADIDCSEGSHVWNFTRPAALVAARLCEFIIPEAIKVSLPDYSYGEFLDGHATARSITRKAATSAIGTLTITGSANTEIPAGSVFSTAAVGDGQSIDYETMVDAVIPAGGSVSVQIRCRQTGVIGNTTAGTIVIIGSRINGVVSVTNAAPVTGGTEEEDDDSLRERILEFDQSQGNSYVGSVSDYKRWAESESGVGNALVIPAQDSTGMVRIILTDDNGDPATTALCTRVYNKIMSPDDEGSRLAPVNANLTVTPPDTITIGVQATVELTDGATIGVVKAAFITQLDKHLISAMGDGEVKLTKVAAILSGVSGVNDYSGIKIGAVSSGSIVYGTSNIEITSSQLPVVGVDYISLTEGTV